MKTTNISAKQAALLAVLVLGSSAWVSAQPNQGRSGQPGTGLDSQQNRSATNSQYTPGRSGQSAGGQNRPDNYGAASTNSQYNQGKSGLGGQQNAQGTNAQAAQPQKINKGSSLIGTTVKNQQGETLGKISDLVIDFKTERVAYVVLDNAPGVLSAQKLHAVPLRAFQPDATGTALILNAEKAQLDRAAGFSTDNWPTVTAPVWGAQPFWKNAQGTNASSEKRTLEHRSNQEDLNQDSETTPQRPNALPKAQPRP